MKFTSSFGLQIESVFTGLFSFDIEKLFVLAFDVSAIKRPGKYVYIRTKNYILCLNYTSYINVLKMFISI